eukprot:gene11811-13706_t
MRGHLDCLRYAMKNGPPYSIQVVLLPAVMYGHLDCVRYLVEERNIKPDDTIFQYAFVEGHFFLVKYLIEVGCPFKSYEFEDYPPATIRNDGEFLQCIQYAVEHGWQYNDNLLALIEQQDLPLCQEYVRKEGWEKKRKLDALLDEQDTTKVPRMI